MNSEIHHHRDSFGKALKPSITLQFAHTRRRRLSANDFNDDAEKVDRNQEKTQHRGIREFIFTEIGNGTNITILLLNLSVFSPTVLW